MRCGNTVQIGLLVGMLLLSGCVTRITAQPGVVGRVVDRDTGEGIAGAEVLLEVRSYEKIDGPMMPPHVDDRHEPVMRSTSDSDGTIHIEPITSWGLYFPPMDIFPWVGRLAIRASGYQLNRQVLGLDGLGGQMGEPKVLDIGEVRLIPE